MACRGCAALRLPLAVAKVLRPKVYANRSFSAAASQRPTSIRQTFSAASVGSTIQVTGYVQSARVQKQYSFMQVNDGSCTTNLQMVWPTSSTEIPEALARQMGPGCSVTVSGKLVASPKPAQPVELQAENIILHGPADPLRYPLLQKKVPTAEYLREVPHIRPRAVGTGAMLRVRHTIITAIHDFFDSQGFCSVSTPVLTANDCEGAGELFSVLPAEELQRLHAAAVPATATAKGPFEWPPSATPHAHAQAHAAAPKTVSMQHSFFGKPVYLTVSGQLHLESFACALGKVYTLGPTFRAENSNTPRHLAEFWMLEPEMAPGTMSDAMDVAEACVRHVCRSIVAKRADEVKYFNTHVDNSLAQRLETLASDKPFARMSYTEAISVLQKSGVAFKFPVAWAGGLATEHERWLAEAHVGGPVFVHDYPKAIKPFYMRQNGLEGDSSDNKAPGPTVASFDLLVPRVGELVGGSAREERYEVLAKEMKAKGLLSPQVAAALDEPGAGMNTVPADADNGCLDWYLDSRKYGTIPHAGWGLGVERLVMLATGIENIRDAIPVPRVPGGCRM